MLEETSGQLGGVITARKPIQNDCSVAVLSEGRRDL